MGPVRYVGGLGVQSAVVSERSFWLYGVSTRGMHIPFEVSNDAVDFVTSNPGHRVRDLAMEVRQLHDVAINEAEGADSGSRDVGGGRASQPTSPHDEDRRRLEA